MITYKNLDTLVAFGKLQSLPAFSLSHGLTAKRIQELVIHAPALYSFYYGGKPIDETHKVILQELCDEAQLIDKYKEVLKGALMNTGEGRGVLHHLTRGSFGYKVELDGLDMRSFYKEQIQDILTFANQVQNGSQVGSTNLTFKNVVQIGIGGSDLGPKAIYLALKGWVGKDNYNLKAHFLSNVDPDDACDILDEIDLARTLFIVVSKSGTTQETLTNELFIRKVFQEQGLDDTKHFIAVTSKTSPLAHNPQYLASFYIDDSIGGRYSSTSAVGVVLLALTLGATTVDEFLRGAHESDKIALNPSINKNPALLDALLGVYERNVLGYPSCAVLPYSQAMSRFTAHLQQLDMESNGKSVNRNGSILSYPTGPLIFGESGTNGQHSFYQLLHQGTDIIPLQFIGFRENQRTPLPDNQRKLKANLIAQIVAFTQGQKNEAHPNKNFTGERPSSLLWAKKLTPFTMGALLSHFENKIMFQGFLWNINSFDQEGVQLGKMLTNKVLEKNPKRDPTLIAWEKIVGLS